MVGDDESPGFSRMGTSRNYISVPPRFVEFQFFPASSLASGMASQETLNAQHALGSVSPVMDVPLVVAHGDRDAAHLGEVKIHVVLVVVRGDPAYPNTGGLLPRKDPD